MSTGLKANGDGSAAIQVGGTDFLTVTSGGTVAIPGALNVTGALTVTGGIFAGGISIQPITASVSGNALTVTLNPTTLAFRSSTLSSGTVNTRNVATAISTTVSSGSTLGTISAIASRIIVLAIDNAGTVELAVVNIAGGNQLDETNLITTTAEGGAGAADSANVIYSTTARTSVPYRVVGFVDSTQATAGTWATAPSTIQGVGGQALTALSSIGYGQTWQNVAGSRSSNGTTYYNTTGKPILVAFTSGGGGSLNVIYVVNSVTIGYSYLSSGNAQYYPFSFIVPASGSYSINSDRGTVYWAELR